MGLYRIIDEWCMLRDGWRDVIAARNEQESSDLRGFRDVYPAAILASPMQRVKRSELQRIGNVVLGTSINNASAAVNSLSDGDFLGVRSNEGWLIRVPILEAVDVAIVDGEITIRTLEKQPPLNKPLKCV